MENRTADSIVYVYKLPREDKPTPRDIALSAYNMLKSLSPPLKEKVAIKPNVTIPSDKDSGIVTNSDFVAGMVDYFLDMGISSPNIAIAEGGGSGPGPHGMDGHFEQAGFAELARKNGVRLVNINQDERFSVPLPQGNILKEIGISKTVRDKDTLFINVPKFKTHNLAVTTLCMKNLMGTITPCDERHLCGMSKEYAQRSNEITPRGITLREERLCHKLCDLSMASKPDLNMIEGIVGRDGTAFRHGKNIQTNLVIAGKNVVSVDAVGSYLMGFIPAGIGYLQIAAERGLGEIDIEKINIYEIQDGKSVPCSNIDDFISEIPFEVLAWDKHARDIPLNKAMLERI